MNVHLVGISPICGDLFVNPTMTAWEVLPVDLCRCMQAELLDVKNLDNPAHTKNLEDPAQYVLR